MPQEKVTSQEFKGDEIMLLYYVRHGDPIYDPDSLTELGHRQAEAVAKRLALHGIDEIYSSSSNRAILTSKPTCEILGKEATILDWCHEARAAEHFWINSGNGECGWVFAQPSYIEKFASKEIVDLGNNWYNHPDFSDKTFREGIEKTKKHAFEFLSNLGFTYDEQKGMYKSSKQGNKRIALFAHQGMGLLLLSIISLIPYPTFSTRFDMTHTGVTVIEFPECDGYVLPKILTLSNDSHIYREGLPTKYNNEFYI